MRYDVSTLDGFRLAAAGGEMTERPAGYLLLACYLGDHKAFSARVARDHHERREGSGYPRGITVEDRHVEIVSTCDVYDALITPRPCREGNFDNRSALEEITALAEGGKVSWDIVRRLVACNRGNRPHPDECVLSLEKGGAPPPENNYGIFSEGRGNRAD